MFQPQWEVPATNRDALEDRIHLTCLHPTLLWWARINFLWILNSLVAFSTLLASPLYHNKLSGVYSLSGGCGGGGALIVLPNASISFVCKVFLLNLVHVHQQLINNSSTTIPNLIHICQRAICTKQEWRYVSANSKGYYLQGSGTLTL